jgi:hypothetical protein
MNSAFDVLSSQSLFDSVVKVFSSKIIYQTRDRHIIFLCGGPVSPHSMSMRHRFINFSKESLTEFRIFLAEDAATDLIKHSDEPDFLNIAVFESIIAEISDCIILFPESPGSIAEMGFFSNSKSAIKKLLVVNDFSKQGDSFINVGIVDKINSKSIFRQMIWIDYGNPNFETIAQRLRDRLPIKTGKRFEFKGFSELTMPQKLFVIFQIIYIFRALSFGDIVFCLEKIFGKCKEKQVKHLLSILIAAKYVERKGYGDEFFVVSPLAKPFLEFRHYDIQDLQAKITSFFQKNKLENLRVLENLTV